MKALGITKITGHVQGDASFFSGQPRSGNWTWMAGGDFRVADLPPEYGPRRGQGEGEEGLLLVPAL